MLDDIILFLETALNTSLTTYKASNTTNMIKVTVHNENSLEQKYSAYNDEVTITCTYRDLGSTVPNSPVKDAVHQGSLKIVALHSESKAVNEVFSSFIESYHAKQTESFVYYFKNIIPIGSVDNIGENDYMQWELPIIYIYQSQITNIFDRSVAFQANVITANNGLLYATLEKIVVAAEYPKSTTSAGYKPRYIKYQLTVVMLDATNVTVQAVKDYIYSSTVGGMTFIYTSGTKSKTFDGLIISAKDSISESGFPLLTFVIEGGV